MNSTAIGANKRKITRTVTFKDSIHRKILWNMSLYNADGLTELLRVVKSAKQRYNPNLEIEGILFTMEQK